MHASRFHTWVGDISPDRLTFSAARNVALNNAIESGAEGVVWVDSDIIPPIDGIAKLVEHGKHFVTGVYFQRLPPHFPMFGKELGGGRFQWAMSWPENVLAPMDGCGFGFVYTSVQMLKRVYKKFDQPFEFTVSSEDLTFCLRAKQCGFQLYVDTGVMCQHLGDAQRFGREHFEVGKVNNARRVDPGTEREAG
jgi:hypothetical protein